jgi:hypothetical protein
MGNLLSGGQTLVTPGHQQSGSPHKHDKCCCSAERYDTISDLTELVIAGFVHHEGHPISQHPNAGFSRRREPGPVGDDSSPAQVVGAGGEKASARQSSMSMRLLPSGLVTACPPPRQSRAAGVGQLAVADGSIRSPLLLA